MPYSLDLFHKVDGEPIIIKPRYAKRTAKALGEIASTAKRFDGYCTFTLFGYDFKLDIIKKEFFRYEKNGSLTKLKISPAAKGKSYDGGIHQSYSKIQPTTKEGVFPLDLHIVMMMIYVDYYYDLYMRFNKLQTNHCIIVNPEHSFEEQKEMNLFLSFNVNYLEAVNGSLNNTHEKFVKRYGLYDIYVSAYDMFELEEKLHLENLNMIEFKDRAKAIQNNKDKVINYYRNDKNLKVNPAPFN